MSNDAQIKEFQTKIEAKKAELGTRPKPSYETNMLLDLGDGKKININTLDEAKCVQTLCVLISQSEMVGRANKILGTSVDCKFGDFTYDQWETDLKLRVSTLLWDAEKKKLDAMNKKLADLLSDEAKTADAIADIANQLDL